MTYCIDLTASFAAGAYGMLPYNVPPLLTVRVKGRGTAAKANMFAKLNLVGAVEGLYIGTITKNQESLHLIHRFACR